MQISPRLRRAATYGAALLTLTLLAATAAEAQGRGKGGKGAKGTPPGHAKKHVSTGDAVIATREVLVMHGYKVIRVERVDSHHVIYYRRGNNGRGKGKGPMERMVIRTVNRRVVFDEAPSAILVDIDFQLKL